jgi:branched-chain amino acid transport system substrate-binding protein
MLNRSHAVLGTLALLVALFSPSGARAQQPLEIHFILSLTGSIAFIGHSYQQVFQAAQEAINKRGGIRGRPVSFVYADDASSPQTAIQLLNGLIDQKVPVIIGSPFVAVCQAMLPLVVQSGPVDYCIAPPLHPPAGGYVFVAGSSAVDLSQATLNYLRARRLTRVALITTADATGRDVDEAFEVLFKRPQNSVFQVVASEHYNPSDISVSAQLAHIKATNPQALIAWTVGTPTGTLFRGIRDIGLDVPVIESNGNMTYPEMTQFAPILPNELLFPAYAGIDSKQLASAAVRAAQQFFSTSMRNAGLRPDVISVIGWDAVMIVIDALRHLGPNATASQIHSYIEGLHNYAGINGIYDFRGGNQRGLSPNFIVMSRWDNAAHAFVTVGKP